VGLGPLEICKNHRLYEQMQKRAPCQLPDLARALIGELTSAQRSPAMRSQNRAARRDSPEYNLERSGNR